MWQHALRGFFSAKLTRFLSVGLLNTAVGLSIIYLCKWLFGLGDVAANMSGYGVGIVISFYLNARWTFAYQGNMHAALVRFLAVMLVAYLANLVVVMTLIDAFGVNSYLAQACGTPAFTLTAFLGSRIYAFGATRST